MVFCVGAGSLTTFVWFFPAEVDQAKLLLRLWHLRQVCCQCWGTAPCCWWPAGSGRSSNLQSWWQSIWPSATLASPCWGRPSSSRQGNVDACQEEAGWDFWRDETKQLTTRATNKGNNPQTNLFCRPFVQFLSRLVHQGLNATSVSLSLCHAWVFGETGCLYYGIQGFVFGIGSLLTTCLISVDRCLKICSLRYGKFAHSRARAEPSDTLWSNARTCFLPTLLM